MIIFFFNDTATTEIYTLSLHDALPISSYWQAVFFVRSCLASVFRFFATCNWFCFGRSASLCSQLLAMLLYRSEEHTSELQSRQYLVCRLLLEKKKKQYLIELPSSTDES